MNTFLDSKYFSWICLSFLIIAAVTCFLLALLTVNTHFLLTDISSIRTELNIVAPEDVLKEVKEIQRSQLSREDVARIVNHHAPWVIERGEWKEWRNSIEERVEDLEDFVTDE